MNKEHGLMLEINSIQNLDNDTFIILSTETGLLFTLLIKSSNFRLFNAIFIFTLN